MQSAWRSLTLAGSAIGEYLQGTFPDPVVGTGLRVSDVISMYLRCLAPQVLIGTRNDVITGLVPGFQGIIFVEDGYELVPIGHRAYTPGWDL